MIKSKKLHGLKTGKKLEGESNKKYWWEWK